MTPSQERKREKIVKAMKKNFSDFRQRYGSDAKSVMYATATKQAMDEEERKPRVFRIKTQGGTVTSTRPPDTKSSPRTSGPVMHGPSSNMGPKPNQKMPVASGKAKKFYNKSDREAMERAPMLRAIAKKRKEKEEEEKAAVRADAERISKQSAERKAAGKKLVDPKTQKEVGAKKDTKPIDSTGVKITQASKKETEKHEKKMRKFDKSKGGVISRGRKGRNVGFSGSMLLKRNFPESFMSFGQFFLAEQEQLDELSRDTLASYMQKASDMSMKMKKKRRDQAAADPRRSSGEREELRYRGMDRAGKKLDKMHSDSLKKMDAMNKMKSEQALDEISRETLGSYIKKASDARGHRGLPTRKVDNRYSGVYKASKRIDKMEKDSMNKMKSEENINELSYNTLSSYRKKAATDFDDIMSKSRSIPRRGATASDMKKHDSMMDKANKRYEGGMKAFKKIRKINPNQYAFEENKSADDLRKAHNTKVSQYPGFKKINPMTGTIMSAPKSRLVSTKTIKKVNEDDSSEVEHDYYDKKLDRAGKELGIATNTKISDNDAHKIASEHEHHVQKTGDHLYQGGVSMGYQHPRGHEYEAMRNHIDMHNKYQKEDRFPGPVSPDEKHFSDKEGFTANRRMMKIMSDIRKKRDAKQIGTRKEELSGNQHKIDANKNGKIDAHDFKLLRQRKK